MYSKSRFNKNQLTENFTNVENFSNINGYIDNTYFGDLLKATDWEFDNIFTPSNKTKIREILGSDISSDNLDYLVNDGKTKAQNAAPHATEREIGMWSKRNNNGDIINYHYFQDLYKKLACCIGRNTIEVPYYKQVGNNVVKDTKTINVSDSDCNIHGINWKDSNNANQNANPQCLKFMQRLIAYLEIYDPDNPMIEKYGGCLTKKFYKETGLDQNPQLAAFADQNRSCAVTECSQNNAFKRTQDRKDCTVTICNATANFSDFEAGGNITANSKIVQNCGPESEIAKHIADKDKAQRDSDRADTRQNMFGPDGIPNTADDPSTSQPSTSQASSALAPAIATPAASISDTDKLDFGEFLEKFFKYLFFNKKKADGIEILDMENFGDELFEVYGLYMSIVIGVPAFLFFIFLLLLIR